MPATRLATRRVAKPWGRRKLWPGFADPAPDEEPVGEIWFEDESGADPELLVKYLFTSEKLSIQVHPDNAEALARGYPRGKDEAWLILAAEPDATIALGTRKPVSRERLRAAAQDGSIEELVDWKPVCAGDVIYSAAGTIHAIGAGLTLIEVQQNVDLTYRLYDYGRPRELHLEDGIAVSDPAPFAAVTEMRDDVLRGPKFTIERWRSGEHESTRSGWFVPVKGGGSVDGEPWTAGECWQVNGSARFALSENAEALFAYPNPLHRSG